MLTVMMLFGVNASVVQFGTALEFVLIFSLFPCTYIVINSSANRHMPKTVEESLLGDHSDQWMDSDCPEAKRIKVSYTTSLQTIYCPCGFTYSPAQDCICEL